MRIDKFNKMRYKKINDIFKNKTVLIPIIALLLVLGLSIGYSALGTNLNISGVVTKIRLKSDIRITNLSISTVEENAVSRYTEYNKENLSIGLNLPEDNSKATYKVEVTNIGNVEMGILSIDNLPEELDYDLTDYTLKEKICDTSGQCKNGIKKEFYITIKYKDKKQEVTNYDLNLGITFQPFYTVTYKDITNNNYPTEVIGNGSLIVNLGDNALYGVKVKINETEISDYTYENGILNIPNVNGNVEITYYQNLVEYLVNLYNPNDTVENNTITYNIDTTNNIIDDGLGGTISSGGNLRYYGSDPSNYIDIGDRDSENNVILWRIVGLFKDMQVTDEDGNIIETQDLVKITRSYRIGTFAWDYKENGESFNDWSNSTLKDLLNGAYYNSDKTNYYNGSTEPIEVDFTGIGLSEKARNRVESVLWNLGGWNSNSVTPAQIYQYEREGNVYGDNPTTWPGKIALNYVSNYGYAADFTACNTTLNSYASCLKNNWLARDNQYFLTVRNTSTKYVWHAYLNGGVNIGLGTSDVNRLTYPALYLKSNVIIVGEHTGSSTDPYVVE